VWTGRGDPRRAGSPLSMLAQVVSAACGLSGGEPLEERRRRIRARVDALTGVADRAYLAELLGEIAAAPFPDDDSPRLRAARRDPRLMADEVRRAFADLVRAASAARPVVLHLEDLHWGDPATVRLVDAALRAARDRPLYVLALARPEGEALAAPWADRGMHHLRLRPLPARASERLVRAVLGDGADDATVARLVARADGHAFYLEELIRAAAEGRADLPETVVAMVQSRLEALDPEARRVLRAGSVFGEIFWEGAALALLGDATAARAARGWLAHLVDREILVRRPESRFAGEEELAFRHALLREGSYAMLTEEDRALGHRLAAGWLEARGEVDAIVLAEHHEIGGEAARAAAHYLAASEAAKRAADLDAVVAHARRGLACGAAGKTQTALLGLLSEGLTWHNQFEAAKPHAEEVMRLSAPGSVPWAQGASTLINVALKHNDLAALLSLLERARAVEPAPDAVELICLTLVTGIMLFDLAGQVDAAERLLDRMHEIAQSLPADMTPQIWADGAHAVHDAFAREDLAGGLAAAERMAAGFEAMGHRFYTLAGRLLVSLHRWSLGERAAIEPEVREHAEAQVEIGLLATYPLFCLSALLAHRGALDDARRAASALIEAGKARQLGLIEGRGRWALASAHLRAGDLDAADREATSALDLLATIPLDQPGVLATRAAARRAAGRLDEALADAEAAAQKLASQRACAFFRGPFVRLVHAECLAAAGRTADAHRALKDARDRLLAIAASLEDPARRQRFLEEVPENARTLELAHEWLGDAAAG
jgi:hypothetical protein